ncbi:hypothetical protein [Cuniculiplasma divulgatum]|uniref:hypothetical protein n=1 Tax=Cuniculiplasma divulgatum TaxID=1673428 RepID=UPI000B6BD0EB|nr:hypothetical protein [Cuniculiplasma divulgatum]OWP54439.1 MAG: hypothetical protein B2I18_03980 [Cuniculiplasma sp. C_DKE]
MNARIKIKTAIKFTLFYPIKWRIFYCPLANLMEALSSLGLFAMPSLYSLSPGISLPPEATYPY